MHKTLALLDYYCFSSIGKITYDPKKGKFFEPWWAILECDKEILKSYKWLLFKKGIAIATQTPTSRGNLIVTLS